MAYIDSTDFTSYLALYGGTDIQGDNFDILVQKASDDIDTAVYNRISELSYLSDYQQTQIKYAVCNHAQVLADYGDTASLISSNRKLSLGDLSVEGDDNTSILNRMSNRTKDFLSKSGLSVNTVSVNSSRGYWR